jgi:hypothetical protein
MDRTEDNRSLDRAQPCGAQSKRAAAVCAALAAMAPVLPAHANPLAVRQPMTCSRGPSGQWFSAVVTMPAARAPGATITVRIDSTYSGTISHFGLNYIYNMRTDYRVSAGATYVEGSARLVAGTGSPNVRGGARVWHDAAGLHTLLTDRVGNGSSYTPPSIEFELTIDPSSRGAVAVEFAHYSVTANAFLIGDLGTTCEPSARPATIGATRVAAP